MLIYTKNEKEKLEWKLTNIAEPMNGVCYKIAVAVDSQLRS
jgi:hypothetical protein